MAKYIDLLRSHQHPDESKAIHPSQALNSPKEDRTPFETLLPDEGLQPIPLQAATPSNKDSLLIDEEPSIPEVVQSQLTHHADNKTSQNPNVHWLNDCTQHVLTIFKHAQQNTTTDISPLSKCVSKLLSQLIDDEQQHIMDRLELNIAQQTQQIRQIDEDLGSLVQKSILMMLYAIKAGQRLKLEHDELRAHTLAAMLHHIGMAQVSPDIRHKKERLNKSELAEIKKAAQNGHHFLEQCNITDPCILQAASQSPERYDGRGESGLSGSEIAWSARLTGVLSMFEALIHYRPYRARLLPRDAIREIVKHHKKSFDPMMLKALIESISLYPIGTYVQLNSG
ncbi:MAG: hypothetical protein Q9M14_07780, partial [Mariprofundaceae bacterium]|nr:hypothetical protein [Mariprofundaceae bacterium]